ncbi:MAG: radical SAM protein [Solirubrobacteraceae bacterium]
MTTSVIADTLMSAMGPRLPQLRVTVNSRCQRACFYCRPSGESVSVRGRRELALDDLLVVGRAFVGLGITEVKLTGGDPALWGPVVRAVPALKAIGFERVEVISRHPRIGELAPDLAAGGVDLVNLSVDTLDPALHREITGVDDLESVLAAVRRSAAAAPSCKVNVVVMSGVNDGEVDDLIGFCADAGVSTVKLLDVIHDLDEGRESFGGRLARLRASTLQELYVPLGEICERLAARAVRRGVRHQGGLGHPMTSLTMPEGVEVLIKDHSVGAWYGDVCRSCRHYPCHDALMAIRLTSDLRIQLCLLREDTAVSVAHLLDDPPALRHALARAMATYSSAEFREEGAAWLVTS